MALRPDWTFEGFVVTEATSAAFERAVAFASRSAGAPRLLFLLGPSGVGKSHLLQSILHSLVTHEASAPVVYTTAAEYVRDLIVAGRRDSATDSQPTSLPAAVLAVDDLHVLRDRPATQREVAGSFKSKVASGGRVLCAAGCRPADIPLLLSSLRERAEASIVALRPARGESMRRVVASLAASAKLDLAASTVASIASGCNGDVRRAVGAITRRRFERAARSRGIALPGAASAS